MHNAAEEEHPIAKDPSTHEEPNPSSNIENISDVATLGVVGLAMGAAIFANPIVMGVAAAGAGVAAAAKLISRRNASSARLVLKGQEQEALIAGESAQNTEGKNV